ncbi:hypothetical protein EXIGLDRAFT_720181 [Exidia glandulosa HHB12029]|uniref:Secreted protein n=1 Tax=Exidia glandulosa HHB12029 TaxID=1314781 RepID=A0A166ACN9_EXIGL|nr:hypothetical protein EXIGLDRAFT_720181 [Exidia glandulosa HHB12029]
MTACPRFCFFLCGTPRSLVVVFSRLLIVVLHVEVRIGSVVAQHCSPDFFCASYLLIHARAAQSVPFLPVSCSRPRLFLL